MFIFYLLLSINKSGGAELGLSVVAGLRPARALFFGANESKQAILAEEAAPRSLLCFGLFMSVIALDTDVLQRRGLAICGGATRAIGCVAGDRRDRGGGKTAWPSGKETRR